MRRRNSKSAANERAGRIAREEGSSWFAAKRRMRRSKKRSAAENCSAQKKYLFEKPLPSVRDIDVSAELRFIANTVEESTKPKSSMEERTLCASLAARFCKKNIEPNETSESTAKNTLLPSRRRR